ncbi:hypothetical protein Pcac1_g15393 [Phytophthora cactorum]|nr:hypothetical protein Pcac1_g15393 [Phytophthora cactorum]KAG2805411.1 hypothetical protein PC111_g17821 [Phytophthora cactorum]KAG3017870.1 hypothetical protein PC120_g10771 [Phytophthora cactorum]
MNCCWECMPEIMKSQNVFAELLRQYARLHRHALHHGPRHGNCLRDNVIYFFVHRGFDGCVYDVLWLDRHFNDVYYNSSSAASTTTDTTTTSTTSIATTDTSAETTAPSTDDLITIGGGGCRAKLRA